MEDVLEKDPAAGNRPLEGSGEEDVGEGQGFDGEGLCCCSDMASKSLLQSSEQYGEQSHHERMFLFVCEVRMHDRLM